jgi:hypothetical protein
MPRGCCSIVLSVMGLTLAVIGHVLYSMREPTGELPLWYTLQTCRRTKDLAIGPRNFDLYPLTPDGSTSECAEPYDSAASASRIMIDESDGVRKGVSPQPHRHFPKQPPGPRTLAPASSKIFRAFASCKVWWLGTFERGPWASRCTRRGLRARPHTESRSTRPSPLPPPWPLIDLPPRSGYFSKHPRARG